MSEDLTRLMYRVAADSPPMDVSLDSVIGEAKGRRRRQRTVGAGMGFAALALAGTLWWGLGGQGLLGGGLERSPAGPSQGVSTDGGSRIAQLTGDTVTAGDRTFRIAERDGDVVLLESGEVITGLGSAELRHSPTFTDESGPGVLAAMVPPGQDPAAVRYGVPGDGGRVTWEVPDSAVRLDLTDGRSVLVLGLAETREVAFQPARPDARQLIGAQVGEAVEPVPVAVFGAGDLDLFAGLPSFVAMEDGRELAATPLGDGRSVTFAAADGATAFVLVDPEGPRGVPDVVVRDLGRVQLGALAGQVLRGPDQLDVVGGTYTYGVAEPGTEVLGAVVVGDGSIDGGEDGGDGASGDGAGGDSGPALGWVGASEVLPVETERGRVLVAADLSSWAIVPGDVGMLPLVGGVGEALLPTVRTTQEAAEAGNPHTFDVVAVLSTADLSADAGPSLVTEGEVTLVGEEQVGVPDAPGGGVTVYSATVTVPEDSSLAFAVRGLDVDGDGAVDLPLVTANQHWDTSPDGDVATLLGEPYLVDEGADGWPVLVHLDDPDQRLETGAPVGQLGELQVTPERWSWEGGGRVLAVPGWAADPTSTVGFTSTDPADRTVDQPEGWIEPRDRVVVEGPAGPVTLVALTPAQAAHADDLMVVGVEGEMQRVEDVVARSRDGSADGSTDGSADGSADGSSDGATDGSTEGSSGDGAGAEKGDELGSPLADDDATLALGEVELDGSLIPRIDGEALADTGTDLGGGAKLYHLSRGGGEADLGILVVPGHTAEDAVIPLENVGRPKRDLGNRRVLAARSVEAEGGPVLLQALSYELLPGEGGPREVSLVVLSAERLAAGDLAPWSIVGSAESVRVVLEERLQVALSVDRGLWLLGKVPDGPVPDALSVGLGEAVAGTPGEAAEWITNGDGSTFTVATVVRDDQSPELVTARGATVLDSEVVPLGETGFVLHHAVVSLPGGFAPADYAPGYDLDGDGEADLKLTYRG